MMNTIFRMKKMRGAIIAPPATTAAHHMNEASLESNFAAIMKLMNPEARGPVQMPENVLTEIFHIAMINHSTLPADSKLRSALMGVCRQWRRLIAKNPAFWTFLDFRKAEGMTALDALVMLYEHFERSSVTFFLNLDLSKFKEGELDLQALHYGVTQKTHCCAFLKLVLTTHAQVQQFLPLHPVFSSLSDLWVDIGINPLDPSVNKDFCVFRPAFVTPIQTFGEGFAPVRLKMSIGLGYVVDLGSLNTSRLVSVDVRTQSTMVQSVIMAEQLDDAAFFGPGASSILSALYSPRLRYLSLQGMQFSCDLELQWVTEAIGRMTCLEVFQLQFMPHVPQAHGIAKAIIHVLAGLPVLHEIHIWNRADFYTWRQRFIDICVREDGVFGRLEHVILDNKEFWPAIVHVVVCMRPSFLHASSKVEALPEQPSAGYLVPLAPDLSCAEDGVDTDDEEEVYAKLVNGTMYQSLIGAVHH